MIKACRLILLVAGLIVATNAFAQQPPKLKTIAANGSFVLYVADNIQRHKREFVYTTVIVQRNAQSLEDEASSIYWSITGWSVNCKSRNLTRYSNEIFDENNKSLTKTTTTQSHPLDALAEIHVRYVCDGEFDHPRLATLESVDGRIAIRAAVESLIKAAETVDTPVAADDETRP